MIASIAIAATLSPAVLANIGSQNSLMFLPLALASVGILCSIGGIQLVHLNARKSPARALRIGTIGAPVLFIIAAWALIRYMDISANVWGAVVVGAVGGIGIGLITEYYTGGKPVRDIAKSGETGPATVMISGLAVGMESVGRAALDHQRDHPGRQRAHRAVRRRHRGRGHAGRPWA